MTERPLLNALLSCSDKRGLSGFAAKLVELGYRLYASDGTCRYLEEHRIPARSIVEEFDLPPLLNGRVKTLHPKIFAGLLAPNEQRKDQSDYISFDILVGNLYTFEDARKNKEADLLEFIDIGGVALLRAAAKNWPCVLTICDPDQYDAVSQLLADHQIDETVRRSLAARAIRHTSNYDAHIAAWLEEPEVSQQETTDAHHTATLGASLKFEQHKLHTLRYGENPQQKAALYVPESASWRDWFRQIEQENRNGHKEISYNNLNDAALAWETASSFNEPCCAIIKHATPCGVAIGTNLLEAWDKAYRADSISSFGGIVAFNRPLTPDVAAACHKKFLEMIVAPARCDEARKILQNHSARFITPPPQEAKLAFQPFASGFLVQTVLPQATPPQDWVCATPDAAREEVLEELYFAWRVVRQARSNAIVLSSQGQTRGIGAGFTNRVDAARYACLQSKKLHGASSKLVAASDAFLPFTDTLDILKQENVTALVQPKGGKKQSEVIDAARDMRIALWLAPERLFRH